MLQHSGEEWNETDQPMIKDNDMVLVTRNWERIGSKGHVPGIRCYNYF